MAWHSYDLDREVQKIVMRHRDKGVLKESHKMRVTVAYGLERFWGEHLRLISKKNEGEKNKGRFWLDTWETLVATMKKAGIEVPNEKIHCHNGSCRTEDIRRMTDKLWDAENFPIEHQRVALAVLTQLCDGLVWWMQRYQNSSEENTNE